MLKTSKLMKHTKRRKDTLTHIRSLKPSTELADNIEKVMRKTRKAELREGLALETY